MDNMRGYSYALKAARDAVNIHSGALNFVDALRTAAGLYTASWTEFQTRKIANATRTGVDSINADVLHTPKNVNTSANNSANNSSANNSSANDNGTTTQRYQIPHVNTPVSRTLTARLDTSTRRGSFGERNVSGWNNGGGWSKQGGGHEGGAFTLKLDGMFPTLNSHNLFAYNHNIQSVLMERDPLLCKANHYLREKLSTSPPDGSIFTFRKLITNYLAFMQIEYVVEDGAPFGVPFNLPQSKSKPSGDLIYKFQTIKFPSRRAWAAFAALYFLWKNTPCAPRLKMIQLYPG